MITKESLKMQEVFLKKVKWLYLKLFTFHNRMVRIKQLIYIKKNKNLLILL